MRLSGLPHPPSSVDCSSATRGCHPRNFSKTTNLSIHDNQRLRSGEQLTVWRFRGWSAGGFARRCWRRFSQALWPEETRAGNLRQEAGQDSGQFSEVNIDPAIKSVKCLDATKRVGLKWLSTDFSSYFQSQISFHWIKIPIIVKQFKSFLKAKCCYHYI